MPDIEEDDARRDGEPLDRVAVVLLDVGRRRRPVANQTVGRGAGLVLLHHRERQQVKARLAGERSDVEILPDRPARRIGELEQARRRRRDDAGDGDEPGRRRDRRQRGAIGEVARDPAALRPAPRPMTPPSASGVTTKKPTLPSICRLSRKTVRSSSQRPWRTTRRKCCASAAPAIAGERCAIERRLGRACFEARLERVLLRRAIELPEAEARGEQGRGDGGQQDQRAAPAPAAPGHAGRGDRALAHQEPARVATTGRRR